MMDLGVIRKGMAEKMMMLMDMTTHKYVSDKQSDVFWRCLDYNKFDVKNWGNTPSS